LLIVRVPDLISWLNTEGDFASPYVLADAIAHGHTGQVVMSTQGAWVSLAYGLLTHGLSFHRVLWEISPALLTLATACLIGWTVARVATRMAGALTVALIVAASPTGLLSFIAPWAHNTTLPAVALLEAFLVWLYRRRRGFVAVAASVVGLSLVIGACLASDHLLATEGLMPFLIVPLLLAVRSRDWTSVPPVVAVAAGSVVVAEITAKVMRSLHFVTTAPPLRFSLTFVLLHLKWLVQGLLRMGNGLSNGPLASIRIPLTVAAAIVTVCALRATFRLARRSLADPGEGRTRARTVHVTFWSASLLCAAAAYVVTTVVQSDQYFLVAIPAVAATVPLLLDDGHAGRRIAVFATVVIGASIVALACGDLRYGTYRGVVARQAGHIEALVHDRRLGIGYAGYWDAAPLDWTSHEKLQIYPLTDIFGHTEPMDIARVAAWYRPRVDTPSYLVLAPGDNVLANRLPRDLPRPQHELHVGQVTLATYPYDIAAYLHAPIN
jgi:hypothetical protein